MLQSNSGSLDSRKGNANNKEQLSWSDECHQFVITIALVSNILSSADSKSDPRDSTRFSVEVLIKLTPAGVAPHHLYIEKSMVLMLLRSHSPKHGLCNNIRLILS